MKEASLSPLNNPGRFSIPDHLVRTWLLAAILEGCFSIGLFFYTYRTSQAGESVGFSTSWLVLLLGLVIGLCALIFLAYRAFRSPQWEVRVAQGIQWFLRSGLIYGSVIFLLLMGVFVFTQCFHFSGVVSDPYVLGYFQKLRSVFFWLSLVFGQTLAMLPLFRSERGRQTSTVSGKTVRLAVIVFSLMLVLGVFIAATGIGIEPDLVGWDGPGTPLLFIQVGAIWAAALLYLAIEYWVFRWKPGCQIWLDIWVSLLLWGFAMGLWIQEPLTADYFAPAPRAPNYEIYPYSDAALHDVNAQGLLIGEGFPGVSRKPLYVLFLALLHAVAGQNYLHVVSLQVGVLALIPVFIYWLTKGLHHRLSGFIAAGLVILREQNAISLSGEIRVSHSKLMMSDLPAVLAVVLLTWLVTAWLKEPSKKRILPLWIGGLMGLLLLLRPQFSLLIPLVILFVLVYFYRNLKTGIVNLGLITFGMMLTLSPWLWRSYQLTGTFSLNDPNQMAFLTEQYHLDPQTESLQLMPGESFSGFNRRISTYVREFILQNPEYVAGFISAHYLHNAIEMVQVLPMSLSVVSNNDSDLFPHWRQYFEKLWNDCCSVQSYVEAQRFWDPWFEAIKLVHLLPLVINLVFLSVGLSAAWTGRSLVGWLPLGFSMVYSFSTAVGRYSGWRLILPADWVILLYYAIGLGAGILWLRQCYFPRPPESDPENDEPAAGRELTGVEPERRLSVVNIVFSGLLLLCLGLTPLAVEAFVPKQFEASLSLDDLGSAFPLFDENDLREFLENEGGIAAHGRALYPRFYRAGEGEPGESWSAFLKQSYPRLGFYLVGPYQDNVLIYLEKAPSLFPHTADVIVLGCQQESFLDAAAVKINHQDSDQASIILRDSLQELHCPLPPAE